MSVALASSSTQSAREVPLRVMVVDDSVVIRGLISRWVNAEPDMEVVASLRTGLDAVNQLDRIKPDVAVLDIEMPDLDGISALPRLLAKQRDLIVIMASTLTRRNAEISLKALSLGASDYIPKPATNREVTTSTTFRHELVEKVRQLGGRRKRIPGAAPGEPRARAPFSVPSAPGAPARAKFSVPEPGRAAPASHGHGSDFKL